MIPLESVEEALNWKCPSDTSECCTVNFTERKLQKECGLPINETDVSRRNKVLLCHDMKGGYLDDATLQGNDNVHAYRFYHWHLIDIFVYFSHHFITIPPFGWILQAHKNGVQCLGTMIIENCDNFLKLFNLDNFEAVARQLNEIRKFYNFDGWLINVECAVKNNEAAHIVSNICAFLKCLSSYGNEVVWYDAITESGDLKWQNCLNKENKIFYNNCGKIFTNYCWNKSLLVDSLRESKGCGDTIFVGIDCFGRGCPGGGGFNCKDAFQIIEEVSNENDMSSSKLSVALFAPGWCYESDELLENDLDVNVWLFFDCMVTYLQSYLDGTKLFRQLPQVLINNTTSFHTNFDLGQGYYLYREGAIIENQPYNNLKDQGIIPSGDFYPQNKDALIKLLPCRDVGFCGYGCFKMVTIIPEHMEHLRSPIVIELFRLGCHISREIDVTLNMYLGEVEGDIVHRVYLKLTFSVGDSRIQSLEYKIGDILDTKYITGSSSIKWKHVQIVNLCSKLGDEVEVVLRKVDVIVKENDVLHNLAKATLYFGQFNVERSDGIY